MSKKDIKKNSKIKKNTIKAKSSKEIEDYLDMLNFLRKKLDNIRDKNRELYEENISYISDATGIDRYKLVAGSNILKKHIKEGTYLIHNTGLGSSTYKDIYGLYSLKDLYVKYDYDNPFYFKELATGKELPISFYTDINLCDYEDDYVYLCDILNLPYKGISEIGLKKPSPISIRVSINNKIDRIDLMDGIKAEYIDKNLLDDYLKHPNEVNDYISKSYEVDINSQKSKLKK